MHRFTSVLALSLAAFACGAKSATPPGPRAPADASHATTTFACGDSLPRADGTQRSGTPCNIAREYCYEASGGTPVSHGAQCRALPTSGATCADLIAGIAGATCSGTTATGLRVQFAYP